MEQSYYKEPTRRQRIRAWLFPWHPCPSPLDSVPEGFPIGRGSVLYNSTCVHVSWLDLLRVMVTRKMIVETRTATENEVGQTHSTSVANVVPSFE